MAKKKKAVEVEILAAAEDGEINLDMAARLDFVLNKNDIIEYYLAGCEEELEDNIRRTLVQIDLLDKKAFELKDEFAEQVKQRLVKENSSTIRSVIRALKKLHDLGFDNDSTDRHSPACRPRNHHDFTASVSLLNIYPGSSKKRNWDHGTADSLPHVGCEPELSELVNSRDYNSRGGQPALPGKKVPPEIWGGSDYSFWYGAMLVYSLSPYVSNDKPTSVATLCVGDACSDALYMEWDETLTDLATRHVQCLNDHVASKRKLHKLLLKHDSLPQMKRAIKKSVVGRVLRNTDEGKLMLKALEGIRNLDATNSLADNFTTS